MNNTKHRTYKVSPEILDRAIDLAQESLMDCSNPGICLACGEEQDDCEPDARNYKCEACEERAVFGAEEILIMGG